MVFLSKPKPTTGWPSGIPFIIGNEAAERFSYYGMKSILVVFMTQYLMDGDGKLATMPEAEARGWFHIFAQAVYFLPLLGSILSDGFLGKYKTIISLSLVYCLGHLALALDQSRMGLAVGLGLIALGSGGIKPCVAANVGDQFGESNKHLISRTFSWFYFSINFGSFFSTLLIPWLLDRFGAHVAFGVPGLLMLLATVVFFLGRNDFVHVPPAGMGFVKETFSFEGLKAIGKLTILLLFLAPFWSLFDQTASAWVLQSKKMDLNFLGMELLPSQTHAANPILVMILAPLFAYVVYPAVNKVWTMTPLRKISIGFFVAAGAFVFAATLQSWIDAGERPSIWWQFLGYVVITISEVMVSITALEFFYTQGPRRMKSLIMSIKMLSISVGNAFTAAVNFFIQNDDGTVMLEGASYYLFFAAVMLVTAVLFVGVAKFYQEKTYLQDEAKA